MAHILIIDDEPSVRGVFKRVLELVGHEVFDTQDARVGLKACKEQNFDLIITDMVMPEYSGINTIMDILRDYPAMKIIAVSGGGAVAANRYLAIAKDIGAHLVLSKPVSKDKLLKAVTEVLG